jgi:hypothetical protein
VRRRGALGRRPSGTSRAPGKADDQQGRGGGRPELLGRPAASGRSSGEGRWGRHLGAVSNAAVGLQLGANLGDEGQVGVPPNESAPAGAGARGAQQVELGTRACVGVRGRSWSKRAVDLVMQERRLLVPAPPLPLLRQRSPCCLAMSSHGVGADAIDLMK